MSQEKDDCMENWRRIEKRGIARGYKGEGKLRNRGQGEIKERGNGRRNREKMNEGQDNVNTHFT